jgi:hypothetical protein
MTLLLLNGSIPEANYCFLCCMLLGLIVSLHCRMFFSSIVFARVVSDLLIT